MKRFVKSILFFYLFLAVSFMIGSYLTVNDVINSDYFFMIVFCFSVAVLILIAYDFSKNLTQGIKKIYYRYLFTTISSCLLTILLGSFTLYIILGFLMTIGGSH